MRLRQSVEMKLAQFHSKRYSPTRTFVRTALIGLVAAAVFGCVSIPRTTDLTPYHLLDANDDLFIAVDTRLIADLQAERPEIFANLPEGADSAVSAFVDRADHVYASVDLADGGDPLYRIVLSGDFPVGQVRFGTALSRRISHAKADRRWYLVDDGAVAFTFVSRSMIFATNNASAIGAGFSEEPVAVFGQPGPERVLSGVVNNEDVITDLLIQRNIPPEIARQIAVDRLLVELTTAEDGYLMTAELTAPKALQARLVGAAIGFALRGAGVAGKSTVEGTVVRVERVPVSREQLANVIEAAISEGEPK